MKSKSEKSRAAKRISYILLPFVLPLCLIALGILMLANETLVSRVFIAFGILVALIGLIDVVIYASRRKYEVQPRFLITGLILLALGAVLIIIPATVNTLIPVLVGICVLAFGISGISNTFSFRQPNTSVLIPIIVAVTNCLLGLFILIYVLFVNRNTGWNVIGILMIISGVLRIFNEILARISVPKQIGVSEQQTIETTTTQTEAHQKTE